MPQALIVQDPHQAGLAAGSQDVALFEQRGKPIKHRQGPSGTTTDVDCVRSGSHGNVFRINSDALTRQRFDVGYSCDPEGPACNGTTGTRTAPADRGKCYRTTLVISLEGGGRYSVSNDIEVELSTGITAFGVNRPTRRRTVWFRAPRSVKPLAGVCFDASRASTILTLHLSPAVPPCLGVT
jgi:hypothetical protein